MRESLQKESLARSSGHWHRANASRRKISRPNTVFVDLMQGVIASRGPQTKDLIADAKRLRHGTLYVIDRRTRAPEGPVREIREQDIFGEFDVKKGRIVPGSYRPNLKHYILTEDGFFQLAAELEESLLVVLSAIPDPDDEAESR